MEKEKTEITPKYSHGDSTYYMGFVEGRQKERERILMVIEDWWSAKETCSGQPHCSIDECDLCVNCLGDLMRMINNHDKTSTKTDS